MKYTVAFRIWHWLNALIVIGLVGTVLLRESFLGVKTNAEIFISKLSEMSIEITQQQAKILAKAVRDGMWEWHYILGYALAFLVLFRIYLFFKDSSVKENFSSLSLHKKGVKSLYYILYGTLFFMAISGLIIHFYESLHMTKAFVNNIQELHESIYNFILIFIPLHIAGVVIAELRGEKGLISTMVNGKN